MSHALPPSSQPSAVTASAKRPNVLLLMSDQHHADCMGCAGHSVVQTPTMDALAAAGTRFERAYCQDAICTPSRLSLATGLYPRDLGVLQLTEVKHLDQQRCYAPWQHVLADNGYSTGWFGKLHVGNNELAKGWDRSATAITFGHDPLDESYREWLKQEGQYDNFEADWPGFRTHDLGVKMSDLPQEYRDAHFTADRAQQFLEFAAEDARPFFCGVSFHGPHQPYVPAQAYADLYPTADIPLRENWDEPVENLPPMLQNWRRNEKPPLNCGTAARNPSLYQRYMGAYLAQVTEVDHYMGTVLATLDRLGMRDNTVVIYISDHGDFYGGHGMVEKCSAGHNVYEDTLRVPFIVSWPQQFSCGSVRDDLVELTDIYPTLIDLLQLKRPDAAPELPGRSLVPSLRTGAAVGREYAFSENWSQSTIISKRYKLGVWVDPGPALADHDWRGKTPDQLFDREQDPHETNNLIGQPQVAEVEAELRAALAQWMEQTPSEGRRAAAAAMAAESAR